MQNVEHELRRCFGLRTWNYNTCACSENDSGSDTGDETDDIKMYLLPSIPDVNLISCSNFIELAGCTKRGSQVRHEINDFWCHRTRDSYGFITN